MIKKLKRRFFIIIMSIFSTVILGIAVLIFLLMVNFETKESNQVLNYAMSDLGKDFSRIGQNPPPDLPQDINEQKEIHSSNESNTSNKPNESELKEKTNNNSVTENPMQNQNRMFRNWITIDVDKQGNIKRIFRSMNNDTESESDDTDELSNIASSLFSSGKNSGIITINNIKYRYLIDEVNKETTRMVLLDQSIELATLQRLLFVILIAAVTTIFVVYILCIFLSKWAVKPIEKAWFQQREFIANASHELKTPLTVISANADVIMSNPDDTIKSQMKWFGYIKEETIKMSKLINSMLYIAKEDSSEEKIIMSEFNFSDVVEGAVLAFEALIFENNKTIETTIDPDININGDKERITQLIHILVDNAVSHSAESGFIDIKFNRYKGNKVRLQVSNNGEIIPQQDLPRLFDRYYRTDKSHNKKTGGFGLGLSIAKAITDKHNGTISASCTPNGIITLTVLIPIN